MKIVHFITRMDMGGSAQNTIATCMGLAHRYETVLATGATEESKMTADESYQVGNRIDAAKIAGVRVVVLPSLLRRISPINDLKSLAAMVRLLKIEKPDIVHTHTSKAGLLGRLAARFTCVPHVVHTPHGHVFHGHFKPLTAKFFLWIEKLLGKLTDVTVALTHGEAKDYIRFGVSEQKRIRVIHSGIDIAAFRPETETGRRIRLEWGISEEMKLVGTIGWLTRVKGPEILLRAMEIVWGRHPEARLVYVGKGDMEEELAAAAKEGGHFDKIVFAGWRRDVASVIQAIDIFVLPSRNEGMGRVIVEAMAAGKPVIATHTGGIPDLIADETNGLLVPPEDDKQIANAILKLLDNSTLSKEMGLAGRALCRKYSLSCMLEKLNSLYKEFCDAKNN